MRASREAKRLEMRGSFATETVMIPTSRDPEDKHKETRD